MVTVGFLPNILKDEDLKFTNKIVDFILNKGCTALIPKELCTAHTNAEIYSMDELFEKVDFLIILGGDGTMLRFAERAALHEKAMLGVNLGMLGYLADIEKHQFTEAIEQILTGNYKIEKRMMLEANTSDTNFLALNDIYMSKGISAKMSKIKLFINDEYIDTYFADGIIFSTPTGSTAYNLSAGGPILKPDADMIAITPICPHTLYARPFVISSNDIVKLVVCEKQSGDIIMSADGEEKAILKKENQVIIKKSDIYTSIIKTSNLGFYDILRKKMLKPGV